MRLGGSLWLWLFLAGCASASEATSPASHDVIEVAVAPPAATTTASARAPAPLVSAHAVAMTPSARPMSLEEFPVSALGAPSSPAWSKGPSMSVKTGSAVATLLANTGGKIDNAAAVVAGMAPGFRRCYRRALADVPQSAGRVQILVRVGPSGEVLAASPSATGALNGPLISCLTARVSGAQFAAPSKTPSTLTISVTLAP